MQQPAKAEPSPTQSSFAGLLAALAAPARKPAPDWDDAGLEDDVATLSYEKALRAHARYRPSEPLERSLTAPAIPAPALPHGAAQPIGTSPQADSPLAGVSVEAGPREASLKSASITIRLSQAEYQQLHQRAAEAGLTVSAYMRSCTVEAESLRAMVKDTMARLRAASQSTLGSDQSSGVHPAGNRWLGRLFLRRHHGQLLPAARS